MKTENPPPEASIPQEGYLFWAFDHRPLEIATEHFMVTGSTGSGKTTVIRMLMKSILPTIGCGTKNKRALVYDGKREYVSLIYSMKPKADVVIFNPFDRRTFAWDISADVTAPRHANAVASILVPEEPNSQQRFFPDAAKFMLTAVLSAFAAKKHADGKLWSLRDVIVTLRSPKRIRKVVEPFPRIFDMVKPYLDDEKVMPAIISTLSTKLNPFEVVAALWEKATEAGRLFSLQSWLDSEKILVICSSPSNRASLDPINQVLFRRLADLLLDRKNTRDELTWLFLDEVREAGKLDGLPSMLNQGRSKGLSIVLGFQEIEGMEHVYGEKVAGEIFGQCAYKTFLRTNSQKTASWIEGHFGKVQQIETSRSFSSNVDDEANPQSVNVSLQRQIRDAMLGSRVMMLPPTGPRSGKLFSFNDVQGPELEEVEWRWSTVERQLEIERDGDGKEIRNISSDQEDDCQWEKLTFEEELVRNWDEIDDKRFEVLASLEQDNPSSKQSTATIQADRGKSEQAGEGPKTTPEGMLAKLAEKQKSRRGPELNLG